MNKKIIFIITAVIVIGLGLAGYFVFSAKNINNTNSSPANTNIASTNLLNNNPALANMSETEKSQALLRDEKRLSDIRQLQVALTDYYKDNESYPEKLTDLLTKYIQAIPGNPNPGGIIYDYTPVGTSPYKSYTLSYVLEIGAEGVDHGSHLATPQGIATP